MAPLLSKPAAAALGYAAGIALLAVGIRQAGDRAAARAMKEAAGGSRSGGGGDASAKGSSSAKGGAGGGGKQVQVSVNGRFWGQLSTLLGICVPSPVSPEAGYAALIALLLVARTWADIWSIGVQTRIEASIISRRPDLFVTNIGKFLAGMLPISVVNNVLKYSISELQLRFRQRLTKALLESYLRRSVFYQITSVDARIANPDQLLTQDVEKFSASIVDLYSNVLKPTLDLALYAGRLSSTIGKGGPGIMLAYLLATGACSTWLRKPVSRFTIREQQLEGEYRHVHTRLIASSEEIAFYEGQTREKALLLETFGRLTRHLRTTQQFRYSVGLIDTIVTKYLATVVGFYVMSRPFFGIAKGATAGTTEAGSRESVEAYYASGRMLLNMAAAVGRLVLAGRELARLAGFTERVNELMTVLRDLNGGTYVRTQVSAAAAAPAPAAAVPASPGGAGATAITVSTPSSAAPATPSAPSAPAAPAVARPRTLLQNGARVAEVDKLIRFEAVPLATPNGDILVPALSFEVQAGQNTLVAGPNGCGKSSLFRTLRGIWPQFGGALTRPSREKLFYVPQKPYLPLGTLRDQITYPHGREDMARAKKTDADLLALLADVSLEYLAQRPGGLDAQSDWTDVLSGGEKQRLAMARVFYHRPQFAILDECTSAVSVDVEGQMYRRCKELEITLFTVSHRASLWRHHEVLLRFDGRGGYEFRPIRPEEVEGAGAFGS
jgi:ATP-binding cassette, subfamily D (ALD), member 3